MGSKVIRITGAIIALFNIINVLNSTWFFLVTAKFTPIAWLAFNACAPSVALYLAGYFFKKDQVMTAALPFLIFFGTGGLFVFGWSGTSLYAQIGHIAMTMASCWIIAKQITEGQLKVPLTGFIAGLIIFSFIFPLQRRYVMSHPEYIKMLGDSTFEEFTKEKR